MAVNASSANATSWYDSIEVYSSDYEPASFQPGPSVDANHELLAGLRDNDFEMTNSSYTVRFFESGCFAFQVRTQTEQRVVVI